MSEDRQFMSLEEALDEILTCIRKFANDHPEWTDRMLEAADVLEDFFVNVIWKDSE